MKKYLEESHPPYHSTFVWLMHWGKITLFVLDVLAMGSVHLPVTLHVRSGLTRHRSVLCIVVGTLLGPARHRSALCIVVGLSLRLPTGPYSSLVGPLVVIRCYASWSGCHLARTRRCWWAHSSSLGRGQGLLIVIGTSLSPTCFHWVSSSLGCLTLRHWVLVPS